MLYTTNSINAHHHQEERSFSLLGFCTPVSKISTSARWEVNSIDLSNVYKQHECLANNHKSSCMLAHGYRKGDERLSTPQIGAE